MVRIVAPTLFLKHPAPKTQRYFSLACNQARTDDNKKTYDHINAFPEPSRRIP